MKPTLLHGSTLFSLLCATRLCCGADIPLVHHGDSWRYHKGSAAVQGDWKTAPDAGLDATWLTGNGGIGYADNTTETALIQTPLGDMRSAYTTVYYRRSFTVADPVDPAFHLQLTMDFDDGFIAWLDGAYLVSQNSPGAPSEPARTATATASHESSRGNSSPNQPRTFDLGEVGNRLPAGTHVLALMGLNETLTSSDLIQIADLAATPPPPPATNAVGGLISGNTTWFATNLVYTVVSDLTVASGVTLVIEPGVRVQLEPGINFNVADGGRLLAEGTPQAPIEFRAVPGAAGGWGGMVINGSVGSPETRLVYASLSGNTVTCIEVAGGTVALDHVTFGTPSHQYLSLDGSSFLVGHCYFPSSSAPFELVHGTGGIKAGGRGIFHHCFFGTTSSYNDIVDFTGGSRRNQPIVQFYDNVFTGASDDILDLDGTDAWVEGNIFLHSHKNGATPDSSAAVSGGSSSGLTSEITILGNLFFDCDQAATAKQGNFYTLLHNTIVHTTRTGGLDTASGAVNVRDLDPGPPTTFAAGLYLEANIIFDTEQLVRNYVSTETLVTLNNNILPTTWNGPGTGNIIADPLLKHVPQLSETVFTNWESAQVLRDWFSLQPGSPALGTGPNGRDQGGVIPWGASLTGEPPDLTNQRNATLTVGSVRTGFGMPAIDWPNGSGYTHYRWRLDAGPWSAETLTSLPITLTNLADGAHYVEVTGKRDSGLYQDDPVLENDAILTRSRTWLVQANPLHITSVGVAGGHLTLHFNAATGQSYTVQYSDGIAPAAWAKLQDVPTQPAAADIEVIDPAPLGSARFYRIVQPAQP